jgi:two-component system sensor histidine kinase TctE
LKTQTHVGLREPDAATKDEALKGIDAGVDSMTRLTNQLLTLARAEPGSNAIRKDMVDFGSITRQALDRLAVLALDRDIDLSLELDPGPFRIRGHATLLHELASNLVENALRYTPPGGAVIASLARESDRLVLSVEDTGPGIPEGERVQVFERFYRSLGTNVAGSGLGLAIVKEIVVAHDGAVTLAERQPPPGLLVTVTLPVPASPVE